MQTVILGNYTLLFPQISHVPVHCYRSVAIKPANKLLPMGDDAYPPVTLSGNQSPAPFHIPPYFVPLGIKENNHRKTTCV